MEKLQAFGGQAPLPQPQQFELENMNETDGSSSSDVAGGSVLGVSKRKANYRTNSITAPGASIVQAAAASMEEQVMLL